MSAATKIRTEAAEEAISQEMLEFADHLAELLAEEFVRAMKEDSDASGGVCKVLERESAGTEHR